jgi:hypothetical protein
MGQTRRFDRREEPATCRLLPIGHLGYGKGARKRGTYFALAKTKGHQRTGSSGQKKGV